MTKCCCDLMKPFDEKCVAHVIDLDTGEIQFLYTRVGGEPVASKYTDCSLIYLSGGLAVGLVLRSDGRLDSAAIDKNGEQLFRQSGGATPHLPTLDDTTDIGGGELNVAGGNIAGCSPVVVDDCHWGAGSNAVTLFKVHDNLALTAWNLSLNNITAVAYGGLSGYHLWGTIDAPLAADLYLVDLSSNTEKIYVVKNLVIVNRPITLIPGSNAPFWQPEPKLGRDLRKGLIEINGRLVGLCTSSDTSVLPIVSRARVFSIDISELEEYPTENPWDSVASFHNLIEHGTPSEPRECCDLTIEWHRSDYITTVPDLFFGSHEFDVQQAMAQAQDQISNQLAAFEDNVCLPIDCEYAIFVGNGFSGPITAVVALVLTYGTSDINQECETFPTYQGDGFYITIGLNNELLYQEYYPIEPTSDPDVWNVPFGTAEGHFQIDQEQTIEYSLTNCEEEEQDPPESDPGFKLAALDTDGTLVYGVYAYNLGTTTEYHLFACNSTGAIQWDAELDTVAASTGEFAEIMARGSRIAYRTQLGLVLADSSDGSTIASWTGARRYRLSEDGELLFVVRTNEGENNDSFPCLWELYDATDGSLIWRRYSQLNSNAVCISFDTTARSVCLSHQASYAAYPLELPS